MKGVFDECPAASLTRRCRRTCQGFRDTNLPLVILEEVRSIPLREKEGILAWKNLSGAMVKGNSTVFPPKHTKWIRS